MTRTTINTIKKELLNRKKQIIKDLEDIAQKAKNINSDEYKAKFPEFGNKTDENAEEISDYSTNVATEQILEKTLRDINNALDKIKNNTYGICKYCEQPIEEKRMLARPMASACIKCKIKLQNMG